jgi:hypothetical protein
MTNLANFQFKSAWAPVTSDHVDFAFVGAECVNLWNQSTGNQVPLTFSKVRVNYPGNQVPITFECTATDSGGFTYFAGFIEYPADATTQAVLVTSINTLFSSGEETTIADLYLPPRDFGIDFGAGAEFEPVVLETDILINAVYFNDGAAWIPGPGCNPTHTFVNVAGNNGALTTTGFRLQNDGGASRGSTITRQKVDVSAVELIEFSWTQSLSGPWYDNDGSDALVYFGMLFDREHTSISVLGGTWEYNTPFDGYSTGNNRPWMRYWLPRDAGAKTLSVVGRLADATYLPGTSFSKPAGLDLYANAAIRIKLVKDTGKVRTELYVNDTLLNSQLTDHNWPTSVTPVWHYHNYDNPTSYVDVANVNICYADTFLTTFPSSEFYLPTENFDGGEATVSLSTEYVLSLDIGSGETATSELDTHPSIPVQPVALYDGAEASFVLATTTYNLGIDPIQVGEEFNVVLDAHPVIDIAASIYDGAETPSVPLWTRVAIPAPFYGDAEAVIDITLAPAIGLTISVFDGADAELGDLSTAIQFGNALGYEGAEAAVALDTLENYKFYEGTTVDVDLATETTIVPGASDGESVALDLSVFPSEGMGTFRAYDGADAKLDILLLTAVLLYPNEIKDPGAFNWDVLGFMGIDLNNGSCCPINDSHTRIELTDGPAPDQRYDGDKTVFTADLSTLPRFSVSFAEGAFFEGVDPEYLTFNFFDGTAGLISAVQNDYYNFNLCKGNFIPDGDHVNVELVSVDLANCESTLILDGAESHLDIQANPNFQVPLPEGARMEFELVYTTAWILNIWDGPYMVISNPEFNPTFYAGEMSSFVFEEKDIYAFSGEAMSLSGLSVDYSVEFLEVGCLDNEFVPMNENGDADMDKFNPVPVELDFFSHSIKAICY